MQANPITGWSLTSLIIMAIVVFPLGALFVIGYGNSSDIWAHLANTVLKDYLTNSALLMLGVGIVTLLLGVGSAVIITQFNFTGKSFFEWALLLPLAVPTYITAYSYTGLLDVAGPVQSQLRDWFDLAVGAYWFPSIRSLGGAVFVMSFVLYPYIYLLARASLLEQSSSFRNVAISLGHSPIKAFFKTNLAIARPAIIAGLTLVLMETLADYGAVSYFGISTFTTGIFRTWYGLDSVSGAAQLSLLLLSFVIVLVVIEKLSRKRASYQNKQSMHGNQPTQINSKQAALALVLVSIPVLLGFIIPVGQLFVWAIHSHQDLFTSEFWNLVVNTISLAAITAMIALILALLISYSNRLSDTPFTQFSKHTVSLGYAVPGTVIAVGTLIPLASLDNTIDSLAREYLGMSTGLLLSGTLVALIIAYLVRFLAVALGPVESGLMSINRNLDQSARLMGYKPLKVLRTIHIPMLNASLLTACLIVFVDVMKELPATLVLRPFNFNTLAVRAFELASDERLMDASLAAISIVIAGLIPVIFLTKASLKPSK